MSGMPAFGKTLTDDKIWSMVAFTKKLTTLSKEQYIEYDKATKGENDENNR